MNIEQINKRIEKVLKEFEKRFVLRSPFGNTIRCLCDKDVEMIVNFIEKTFKEEIESTLKAERKRIITIIENLDQRITSDGQEANTAYQQAFKDILKEI